MGLRMVSAPTGISDSDVVMFRRTGTGGTGDRNGVEEYCREDGCNVTVWSTGGRGTGKY